MAGDLPPKSDDDLTGIVRGDIGEPLPLSSLDLAPPPDLVASLSPWQSPLRQASLAALPRAVSPAPFSPWESPLRQAVDASQLRGTSARGLPSGAPTRATEPEKPVTPGFAVWRSPAMFGSPRVQSEAEAPSPSVVSGVQEGLVRRATQTASGAILGAGAVDGLVATRNEKKPITREPWQEPLVVGSTCAEKSNIAGSLRALAEKNINSACTCLPCKGGLSLPETKKEHFNGRISESSSNIYISDKNYVNGRLSMNNMANLSDEAVDYKKQKITINSIRTNSVGASKGKKEEKYAIYVTGWTPIPKNKKIKQPQIESKIDSNLKVYLSSDRYVEVIICVKSPNRLGNLPPIIPYLPLEHEKNKEIKQIREMIFSHQREERMQSQLSTVERVRNLGGKIIKQYAIGNCFIAQIPAKIIESISKIQEVEHISSATKTASLPGEIPKGASGSPDYTPLAIRTFLGLKHPIAYYMIATAALFSGQILPTDYWQNFQSYIDEYENLYKVGWPYSPVFSIGIVDSGVDTDHLLVGKSKINIYDCSNETENSCVIFKKDDYAPHGDSAEDLLFGHGTRTVAEIASTSFFGETYRGVFKNTSHLDLLFKINMYKNNQIINPQPGLPVNAKTILNSINYAATSLQNHVILIESQVDESYKGALVKATNDAFDLGSVMIVPAGNMGIIQDDNLKQGTVASPGKAHKAITVGSMNHVLSELIDTSGIGPTEDSRRKPEILMPTGAETAVMKIFNGSQMAYCTDCVAPYEGTSGAAPWAAGLAMYIIHFLTLGQANIPMEDWIALPIFNKIKKNKNKFEAEDPEDPTYNKKLEDFIFSKPGFIHAAIIALGYYSSSESEPRFGLGPSIMPPPGCTNWDIFSINIKEGETIDVPFEMYFGDVNYSVGIWWPEEIGKRNDVDIFLYDPDSSKESGTFTASGTLVDSVFEQINVFAPISEGGLKPGGWTLRFLGETIPNGPIKVYVVTIRRSEYFECEKVL